MVLVMKIKKISILVIHGADPWVRIHDLSVKDIKDIKDLIPSPMKEYVTSQIATLSVEEIVDGLFSHTWGV